ncbi:MAG: putative dsRNA-binding protein, partial [Actinomycetes bacterium]
YRAAHLGAGLDWKTSLQELTAAHGLGVPEYVVAESGPDHDKSFVAFVRVRSGDHGAGVGRTKKEAEQLAAELAWKQITEDSAEQEAGAAVDSAVVDGDTEAEAVDGARTS